LGTKKPPRWGGSTHAYVGARLATYYESDHDAASARHRDFSLPAPRRGSQPATVDVGYRSGRATTNTRRCRSRASYTCGAVFAGRSAPSRRSVTCTSPRMITSMVVLTPLLRLAISEHTASARSRAKSRSSCSGPLPAPPIHVTFSPGARVVANRMTC